MLLALQVGRDALARSQVRHPQSGHATGPPRLARRDKTAVRPDSADARRPGLVTQTTTDGHPRAVALGTM
jgi:hypothetical protein